MHASPNLQMGMRSRSQMCRSSHASAPFAHRPLVQWKHTTLRGLRFCSGTSGWSGSKLKLSTASSRCEDESGSSASVEATESGAKDAADGCARALP